TTETLGILPIPPEIRESSGMAAYISGPIVNLNTGEKKKPQRYNFLAQMQGTRKPVLPVHTMAERLMFRTLISHNREFNPPNTSEPPWNQAVKVWNASVDESDETSGLYYKLSEQLKVYYAQWRKSSNTKEALTRSSGVRKPLADVIHDPSRSAAAPPIPFQSAKPHAVEKGFLDEINIISSKTLPTSAQAQPRTPTPSSERPTTPTIPRSNVPIITAREIVERLARKRVADSLTERQPAKKARKRRTCAKCAESMCPGSQTVNNCKNPCRDCGKTIGCRGRNSKKPLMLCHLAWV
ncbi:hypothetical protein BYT27DRAFT_7079187, partial [Phlegmacium glaucopus]